jgi:rubredoxin
VLVDLNERLAEAAKNPKPRRRVDPPPQPVTRTARAAERLQAQGPIPESATCPTCGAGHDQLQRQSLKKRAAKITAFGVFAVASAAKTFKCQACGYTW